MDTTNRYIGYCRAKTKDYKWIEGYHLIDHGENCIFRVETSCLVPVIPKTICRYTGLTTCYSNRPYKDVFERDFIVFNRDRFRGINEQINSLAPWIVLWDADKCCFLRRRIFNTIQGFRLEAELARDTMCECEVIGNGIDNPDVPETSAAKINKLIQEWRERGCTTE